MRIIFMGTPEPAMCVLERLLRSDHMVVAVVTQPDKPAGRGRRLTPSPVKVLALQHQIPVLQPARLKGMRIDEQLRPYAPDTIVVVAYGKILPREILELPRFGCINVHFSLLPKYRGAAPVQWAIINGERTTGVTIMEMDETLDTGDILMQEKIDILEDDDAISLTNILSVTGAELLVQVLDQAAKTGKLEGQPQDHGSATHARMLKKEDGLIHWDETIEEILCRIRGLVPWPCAFGHLRGQQIKIVGAQPYFPAAPPLRSEAKPGQVTLLLKNAGFTVRTADGNLLVTKVQPENKRVMSAADFINGGHVKEGDKFY
jgi:methionyl-tRNA formyltransferase